MNTELLTKHVIKFLSRLKENSEKYQSEITERRDLVRYYMEYTFSAVASGIFLTRTIGDCAGSV